MVSYQFCVQAVECYEELWGWQVSTQVFQWVFTRRGGFPMTATFTMWPDGSPQNKTSSLLKAREAGGMFFLQRKIRYQSELHPASSHNGEVVSEAQRFSSFARGERAVVVSWAARSTQSGFAVEMKAFPAGARWMNEATAMTAILHWHASARSWKSLCPRVINYILMILSSG